MSAVPALVLLLFFGDRVEVLDALAKRKGLLSALGVDLLCGSLLLLSYSLSGAVICAVGAIVLTGLGMGSVVLLWSRAISSCSTRDASICASGGIALSFIVGSAVKGIFSPIGVAATCVLPVASLLCFALCMRRMGGNPPASGPLRKRDSARGEALFAFCKIPPRLLFLCVLFTFMFEAMKSVFAVPVDSSGLLASVNIASRGIVALVVFLGISFFSWKPSGTYKLGFLLMVAAFLIAQFMDSPLLTSAVFMAGYTLCDIMLWTILSALGRRWPNGVFAFGAIIWVLKKMGSLMGIIMGVGVANHPAVDKAAIAALFAYVIVIAIVIVLDKGGFKIWELTEDAEPGSPSSHFYEAVEATAKSHSLTPREAEVLSYLALGRSVPWISSHMGIAEGTVRTHARHIYEKLGIHDKQELIDLVGRETLS